METCTNSKIANPIKQSIGYIMKEKLFSILSLFTSSATLLCCALPIILVALGFGAAVAGLVSTFPWLVPLTRNKEWIFLFAGIMIAGNWIWIWHQKRHLVACALPKNRIDVGTACDEASRLSRVILWISTGVYVIGFSAAYLAYPIMDYLGLMD